MAPDIWHRIIYLLFYKSFLCRYINIKSCSFTLFAGGRHEAIVILDNFFYDRKTDASAGIFLPSMQALKKLEDLLGVFFLEANAIVNETNVISWLTVQEFRGILG